MRRALYHCQNYWSLANRVARRLNYFFDIGPFTTMEICQSRPKSYQILKRPYFKYLLKFHTKWQNFAKSGHIVCKSYTDIRYLLLCAYMPLLSHYYHHCFQSWPFSTTVGNERSRRVWPVGAVSNTTTEKSILFTNFITWILRFSKWNRLHCCS